MSRQANLLSVLALLLSLASLVVLPGASTVAAQTAPTGTADTVPCLQTTNTLEDFVYCMWDYLPGRFSQDGRDGFDVPSPGEMAEWREVVHQMLDGQCLEIDLSPYSWGSDFTIAGFHDSEDDRSYCILAETAMSDYGDPAGELVAHGWGTFVVNPTSLRHLNASAPHVKYEAWTDKEATLLFRQTRSRSLLLNGAHRYASDTPSDCQPDRKRSDAAHNVQNMFHATVEELQEYYGALGSSPLHIQFHGMGSSSCPGVDVFMSHGVNLAMESNAVLLMLRQNMASDHPGWTITVPGESPDCNLAGTTNVQGRMLNGVAQDDVCSEVASGYTESFIHIEQHYDFRDADYWDSAIEDTWPVFSYHLPLVELRHTHAPSGITSSSSASVLWVPPGSALVPPRRQSIESDLG